MSSFNPNSEKLREFVEAYEAGEPTAKLAERLGFINKGSVYSFISGLIRFGVVDKRKYTTSDEAREIFRANARRAREVMAAERAEFLALKAARASQALAAE